MPAHLAARSAYESDVAQVEPGFEQTMQGLFAKQRSATLSRLQGKRGKTMLRNALLAKRDDPGSPGDAETGPDTTADTGAGTGEAPAIVSPGDIFDAGFWADQTAQAMQPHMNAIGAIASNRVSHSLSLPGNTDTADSLASVGQALEQRAQESAMQITGTTRDQIFQQLQEGVANGEGMPALSKRIDGVFDTAHELGPG